MFKRKDNPSSKITILILIILISGIIFRLVLTSNGNFFFNTDNGRDMVDVREMVVLQKIRLIGPTSAIEGLFNGPAWYYLLAIPFLITNGDPYGSIVLMVLMWAIGGFFLLKIASLYSLKSVIIAGSLWVSSNYIILGTSYAFNPNPVMLLTPLFIFSLERFIKLKSLFFSCFTWFLGGLFFNFEMNFGVFIPPIIFTTIILSKNYSLLRSKNFWLGTLFFILLLLPQIIFDLRHQFIMSSSILKYLTNTISSTSLDPLGRVIKIYSVFYTTTSATLMNKQLLIYIGVIFMALLCMKAIKKKNYKIDLIFLISVLFLLVPFFGYVLLPVNVYLWHLGGSMSALIIVYFLIFEKLSKNFKFGKVLQFFVLLTVIFYSVQNINTYYKETNKPQLDPSLYKNEISAINYIYKYAEGKNFKAYVYLPSVIDYPYQYLIWWYGREKYGYLPIDYAYLPDKPDYISNKKAFSANKEDLSKRENSNLVFLIKEPDRNYTRAGWEGEFISVTNVINLKSIKKEMVGSIEVEIREEKYLSGPGL